MKDAHLSKWKVISQKAVWFDRNLKKQENKKVIFLDLEKINPKYKI